MNRGELVLALAEKSGIPTEESRRVIDIMFDMMKETLLNGGRVEFRGFGSFCIKEYKSYKGRNPHTGEQVDVKPKRLPFFKCGKELHDLLNTED